MRQDQTRCIDTQRRADELPKFQSCRARKTARKCLAPGQPSRSIDEKDMNEFVLSAGIKPPEVRKKLRCLRDDAAQFRQMRGCCRITSAAYDHFAGI